ncbi:unnamed protein product [Prunus brigantina]
MTGKSVSKSAMNLDGKAKLAGNKSPTSYGSSPWVFKKPLKDITNSTVMVGGRDTAANKDDVRGAFSFNVDGSFFNDPSLAKVGTLPESEPPDDYNMEPNVGVISEMRDTSEDMEQQSECLDQGNSVSLQVVAHSSQSITALVTLGNQWWLLTVVYANPCPGIRESLWKYFDGLARASHLPWLVLGDFNDIASADEKCGGNLDQGGRSFIEWIDRNQLVDLGSSGAKFTWCNKRNAEGIIWKRLDRGLCNINWRLLFPEAHLSHLPRVNSDHCPIMEADLAGLSCAVSNEEIKESLFNIGGLKTPGPDGFPAIFYQKFWEVCSNDIISLTKECFQTANLPEHTNETLIALVPKVERPVSMTQLRPISLCNTLYKVVSKILFVREVLWEVGIRGRIPELLMHRVSTVHYKAILNDDLILFGEASIHQAHLMKLCLDEFCHLSGQKVSFEKSRICVSPNICSDLANSIATISGSPHSSNLGKYLGVPIIHTRVDKTTYQEVIAKVQKSAWRGVLYGTSTISKGIKWRVGSGDNVRFWTDNWLSCGPLQQHTLTDLTEDMLQLNYAEEWYSANKPSTGNSIQNLTQLSWNRPSPGTSCGDALAAISFDFTPGLHILDEMPACVVDILAADSRGDSRPRLLCS